MLINTETKNCDFDNHYLINESADSEIIISIEMSKITSLQSRKHARDEITNLIQKELSKFKWIIFGSVWVDFGWYLSAIERQETDAIGDIDNISKPILDALSGESGIIIDDSQIMGLYSFWMSKNDMISDNTLRIQIKFNNDEVLQKENLYFIQYDKAICMAVNMDKTKVDDLYAFKILVNARLKMRNSSGTIIGRYLKLSAWDFHRTRLNGFNNDRIMSLDDFNKLCSNHKLSFSKLREIVLNTKKINES